MASEASAETFKFYAGDASAGAVYSGPFSGGGTVYDKTKNGSALNGTGGTSGGGDIYGTTLGFSSGGIGVTAGTTTRSYSVWQDLNPNFGGLGVGQKTDTGGITGDDQINGAIEVLTFTFDQTVTLTGVATLFYGSRAGQNHCCFGPKSAGGEFVAGDITSDMIFDLMVGNGPWQTIKFGDANNDLLNLTGVLFSFRQHIDTTGVNQPEFYVSALSVKPVPVPGAVLLFGSGLAGLGYLGRRRKATA
ncbi:MAG: VPLPA-CTERM sorting domain-containing protein [Hyphomicrobiales bacterium]